MTKVFILHISIAAWVAATDRFRIAAHDKPEDHRWPNFDVLSWRFVEVFQDHSMQTDRYVLCPYINIMLYIA